MLIQIIGVACLVWLGKSGCHSDHRKKVWDIFKTHWSDPHINPCTYILLHPQQQRCTSSITFLHSTDTPPYPPQCRYTTHPPQFKYLASTTVLIHMTATTMQVHITPTTAQVHLACATLQVLHTLHSTDLHHHTHHCTDTPNPPQHLFTPSHLPQHSHTNTPTTAQIHIHHHSNYSTDTPHPLH